MKTILAILVLAMVACACVPPHPPLTVEDVRAAVRAELQADDTKPMGSWMAGIQAQLDELKRLEQIIAKESREADQQLLKVITNRHPELLPSPTPGSENAP